MWFLASLIPVYLHRVVSYIKCALFLIELLVFWQNSGCVPLVCFGQNFLVAQAVPNLAILGHHCPISRCTYCAKNLRYHKTILAKILNCVNNFYRCLTR